MTNGNRATKITAQGAVSGVMQKVRTPDIDTALSVLAAIFRAADPEDIEYALAVMHMAAAFSGSDEMQQFVVDVETRLTEDA